MLIISQLWFTSHPMSTVVLLDTGTPGTRRKIQSEDANDAFPAIALSCLAQWLEDTVYNRGVASLSPITGILTVNFSTGTRSSWVQ